MITSTAHRPLRIVTALTAAALSLLFAETPATLAQPAAVSGFTLTVDATAHVHDINPDIYGVNFPTDYQRANLNLPVARWGGNATSRYNYNYDISNHALDWYFENVREGNGADPKDDSAANQFIAANNAAGARTLLTVPTIGYISKDDKDACGFSQALYGAQTGNDWQWRSDCGNGVLQSTGQYVPGNNPHDTSIAEDPSFVQDWVSYLNSKFPAGAPRYYELDNEPDLWYNTHRDVHPDGAGYDELLQRGEDYGLAIKAADPSAKVFGPVSWGWWGYFFSAVDALSGGDWWNHPPDRTAHGDEEFLAWYLDQMHQYEIDHGTRILDYLDLHFYTQVPGVSLGSLGKSWTQAARLRSTRSLWDPSYAELSDGSWIDQPVILIPRMHKWIDGGSINGEPPEGAHYPGTKLAITEYNWGALDTMNGALAQADVLGIFGREGLDLATLWQQDLPDGTPPDYPGNYAFMMYRNYDGADSTFGNQSIAATSADQGRLAIYGSMDSGADKPLKLMVINKTSGALTSTLTLNHFEPAACMSAYTYSPANLHAIVQSWRPVPGAVFTASFPANSITLYVIPPSTVDCGAPVSAAVPVILSSPARGGATSSASPKFSWKAAKGAQGYQVQVDTDLAFGSPDVDGFAPKTTLTPQSPLPFGRYYWRVSSYMPDGITDYTGLAYFDITLQKAPIDKLVTGGKVKLSWAALAGAHYYTYEVATDSAFTNKVASPVDVLGTSVSLTLDPGTYYWHVSPDGTGYMPTWSFVVTPAKTPKSGQAITKTPVKFSWSALANVPSYEVRITGPGGPLSPIDVTSTSATSPVLDYGHYGWTIHTSSGIDTPPLSFDVTFLSAPANNAFLTALPTFKWSKVAGATTYTLHITGPTAITQTVSGTSFKPLVALARGAYTWSITTDNGKIAPDWAFIVGP